MEKTWKEAIIKVLSDEKKIMDYDYIFKKIKEKKYYNIDKQKTPKNTIGKILREDIIKNNDTRIKQIKKNNTPYFYFAEYENELNLEKFIEEEINKSYNDEDSHSNYKERDLHKLFVSYLKNEAIYSKTIFHEENNRSDKNQKWINPDIIGVEFTYFKNDITSELLKSIDKNSLFNLYSYELKREIKTDYDLKKAYFQAVSNSSWANYGYLVALEINDNLHDEMERLNKSFGIGIIKLSSNPFESKVLFPAKKQNLDFATIDKLIDVNEDFKKFIEYIKQIINSNHEYIESKKIEFNNFCYYSNKKEEEYFDTNSDEKIKKYCKEKNIPFNDDGEEIK